MELKLPPHKASLILTHNDHTTNYETVKEWSDRTDPGWISEEQKRKAIDANDVWEIQWYPETPVGFYVAAAHDLGALLDYVNQFATTLGDGVNVRAEIGKEG